MKSFELIVPCYNEEQALPYFLDTVVPILERIDGCESSFIFVDDGSRDKTLEVIRSFAEKDARIKYISFSRNFGKEAAMLAGMRMSSADYVGIIDADLQHSPELIPEMFRAVTDEGYDIAAARRIDRRGEAKIKSAFSRSFYKLINKISDANIEEGAQDYRIMNRKVVNAIVSMPEYNRFSKGIFSWVGYKTKWFEHENRERVAGTTKWSFWKLFSYAVDGIIGFSTAPLKLSLIIGTCTSLLGFIYALYTIIKTLCFGPDVKGYPSIICAILIVGGLVLISLGITGEYIARMYMEVKNRPDYLINETNITPDIKGQ
ncbi:MAG: glycosyltransferase family 2 protein [Ruminococcaceae bacterium]|nr:glycosyltransferase family 2 protein [Oscillospiraceae bacterium]